MRDKPSSDEAERQSAEDTVEGQTIQDLRGARVWEERHWED